MGSGGVSLQSPWLARDVKGPTLRTQRLRMVWLLALPYLYVSKPTAEYLLIGGLISFSGLLLRAWAAGSIHKDRELATGGLYGRLRHPLYSGSFLLGFGLALAGGRWWIPALFVGLFFWVYRRTVRAEEEALAGRFGEAYQNYRTQTPAFLPHFRHLSPINPGPGFQFGLFLRNKEWQAWLGTLIGYGLLWARMCVSG